jgi:hypothetical protein
MLDNVEAAMLYFFYVTSRDSVLSTVRFTCMCVVKRIRVQDIEPSREKG